MRKAAGHSAKSSRLCTQGASELLAGREFILKALWHHGTTSSLLGGWSTAMTTCAEEAGAYNIQTLSCEAPSCTLSCEMGLEFYVTSHTSLRYIQVAGASSIPQACSAMQMPNRKDFIFKGFFNVCHPLY